MKKMPFLVIFLFTIFIQTYNAYNKTNCMNELKLDDLNSRDLINYIYDNDLIDKIDKVCSVDICLSINANNLDRSIKKFIEENIKHIAKKDQTEALNAELKGFKIDKFILNNC